MKKNCRLTIEEQFNKNTKKTYKTLFIELESGLKFPVNYKFYNYKLDYRVEQELKEKK